MDENIWDGIDRRGTSEDRRQHQINPNESAMNMMLQLLIQQQMMQQPQKNNRNDNEIIKSTLTVEQIFKSIPMIVGAAGVIIAGWYSLQTEVAKQKDNFSEFKVQIAKEISGLQESIKELKNYNDIVRIENKKISEDLNNKIQELDSTVMQMYQKVHK